MLGLLSNSIRGGRGVKKRGVASLLKKYKGIKEGDLKSLPLEVQVYEKKWKLGGGGEKS